MPSSYLRGLWTSRLNPESPRYETWCSILGGEEVPIRIGMAGWAKLGADPKPVDVYKLDLEEMTKDQRKRLAEWAAQKYGEPVEAVERELKAVGFPIRQEDVIVTHNWDSYAKFF